MASTNRFPSQYTLKQLTLINFKGRALDIRAALIDVDIKIDLFNTCLHGCLKIKDKGDFNQNFPLIGEERLIIEFATDKAAGFISLEFYTYTQVDKEPFGDSFIYTIEFVSPEFLRNQGIPIKQSFKNVPPEKIVEKCLKKISDKKLTVDETMGTMSYIPPSIHPFEVINYCLPRAKSKLYQNGAGYLFYEDLKGFNFRTIESLFKNTPLKYTFNNKNEASANFNNEFYSVSEFKILQHFNVLDNMSKGMYGSRVYEINPYTREYNTADYNYFTDYGKTEHMDSNNTNHSLHTSKFAFQKSYLGHVRFYPTYGYQNKAKNIGVRYSQLNQITNCLKLEIEVPGNTEINVGKMIELDYPNHSRNKDQPLDLFLRGKYLITAVRYILTGKDLKTCLEITKDDYYDNHELNDRVGMLT